MLVKCRKCNKKVERNQAFKVVVGGKNTYYCNEEEYNEILRNKELKDETYSYIYNIFGYKITNTCIYKEVNDLVDVFGYELLLSYLKENEMYLTSVIQGKDFPKEYGKIRYFAAILKNSLADYVNISGNSNVEHEKCIEYDLPEVKYKRKKKRRNLSDIEAEVGD